METRPGTKTTEFAATVAAVVLAGIEAATDPVNVPDSTSFKFGAIAVVAYVISRGLAKLGVKPAE